MSDETFKPAPKRQLIEFGTGRGQVRHADDPAYTDARVPCRHAASHAAKGPDPITPESIGAASAVHKHDIKDLTGCAAEKHGHVFADLTGCAAEKHRHAFDDVDGVAPIRHSHTFEELSGVAAEKHRHSYEELSGVAPSRHTHSAEDINNGVFAVERLLAKPTAGGFLQVAEDGSLRTVSIFEIAAAVQALLETTELKIDG